MGNSRTNIFLQHAPVYALVLVSLVLIASSFPMESHTQLTRRQTYKLIPFNRSENPLKTLKAGMVVLQRFTVSAKQVIMLGL